MTTLRISHLTEYHYDQAVSFGPHRLMMRPRDAHDLRVIESSLTFSPSASVKWTFDCFGNSVAQANFDEPAPTLTIRSDLLIRRYPSDAVLEAPERAPVPCPFSYDTEDAFDLAPLMAMQEPEHLPMIQDWLTANVTLPDEALASLRMLSDTIHKTFDYSWRDEFGTQSSATTISSGVGTCRDFAYLFMEAARSLGFAARFVTGYLHDPATDDGQALGGGATHAWAEVFLPGDGWVEFDPTNAIVGGAELIRVAATRTPQQAVPISGSFDSTGGNFVEMAVDVGVTEVDETAAFAAEAVAARDA